MHGRKSLCLIVLLVMLPVCVAYAYDTQTVTGVDFGSYGQQALSYLKEIDQDLWSRNSLDPAETQHIQDWLLTTLSQIGFSQEQIQTQDFTFKVEEPSSRTYSSQNIIAVLPGLSRAQIVVGAHYDGRGAGDNGSGVAVALEAAARLISEPTPPETVVFVFFGAEEETMAGSDAFVNALSEDDIAHISFMVNLDSVITGDYCYLYGGVPDWQNHTVTGLEAFTKVYALSQSLGLGLQLVPWTFAHPAPGFDTPAHPSPATGDWSNHVSFVKRGIEYVYFEASNWEIPGPDALYDGSGETEAVGPLMHTSGDTLANLEALFPGRTLYHLQVYSMLLHAVLSGS